MMMMMEQAINILMMIKAVMMNITMLMITSILSVTQKIFHIIGQKATNSSKIRFSVAL